MSNHLVIGLGGTGGRVIRALRRTIYQRHRNLQPVPRNARNAATAVPAARIEYLYVDSNRGDLLGQTDAWRVFGVSTALSDTSLLLLGGADITRAFDNLSVRPGISGWIGDQGVIHEMVAASSGTPGANQIRRFGRFLFASKIVEFRNALVGAVEKLTKNDTSEVTFHVCCTLAAGTGSGSIVDAVSQIRSLYPEGSRFPIIIYGLITDEQVTASTGNFYANQYAALAELNSLWLGKYRPHNLAATQAPQRPDQKDLFSACFLLSAINETGNMAEAADQENMIADYIYQRAVALGAHNTPDKLIKAHTYEDVQQYGHENLERAYRFNSLGIKRLTIPEEEIEEKLAFTFAQQAALQFRFSNWQDNGYGFARQMANRDLPEFVAKPANYERWALTDDHLKLSVDLRLSGAGTWPRIADEWNTQIEAEKKDVMTAHAGAKRNWLPTLRAFFERHFQSGYRDRGVAQYYADKRDARRDYAREITRRIETDLFARWKAGEDSVEETHRIVLSLIKHLEERKGTFDQGAARERTRAQAAEKDLREKEQLWAKVGPIADLMFKKGTKVFEEFTNAAKDYCVARTEIEACLFARELTQEVINELMRIQGQVESSQRMISECADIFDREAASRCRPEAAINFQDKNVKLIQPAALEQTLAALRSDKALQAGQARAAREAVCQQLRGEETFASFASHVTADSLRQTLATVCDEQAKTAHENLFKKNTDFPRIVGVNIIERLYKLYGGATEKLQTDIKTLMQGAGAYLQFDSGQDQPGNLQRAEDFPTMPRGSITVFLPLCPGREEFRDKIKSYFRTSLPGGMYKESDIDVVDAVDVSNEIVILSVRYWFALRFARALARLRDRYESKIKQRELETLHQIHLENHRCRIAGLPFGPGVLELAPLYPANMQEQKVTAGALALLARSLGLLNREVASDTGLASQILAERNAVGRPIGESFPLGVPEFRDIADKLARDPLALEFARKLVLERPSVVERYRHIERKQAIADEMEQHLNEVFVECRNSSLDPRYLNANAVVTEAKRLIA